jgi:threonine dehydrogenase-like Zn-dependent dehydrogenase
MAEPLAVVVRAVGRAAPAAGETAAVLGVGSLGLLAVQVLRARGCRVLAVARTTKRLDLALALGAEAVALSGADDDTAAARAFSGREGVDLVIETAGTALAVEQAVNLCRPGGRVVLTGLPHEATSLNFFWVVRRELRIIGSMIYQDEFPEAMRLLATGQVRAEPLVTHRFALDAIGEAFAAHRDPASIKVSVVP